MLRTTMAAASLCFPSRKLRRWRPAANRLSGVTATNMPKAVFLAMSCEEDAMRTCR